ncbi:MAG: toxic anion resistance protein [Oscillospiraceae bacterium]|nr:toxic anion resistance protein [Oscillospiraceae bacterium]
MPLQFKPSAEKAQEMVETTAVEAAPAPQMNIQPVEESQFSMVAKTEEIKTELARSPEIDKLVSQIDVNNPNSLVKFGNEVAEEISKASDQVLNSLSIAQVNDSGELLTALSKVMDRFDATELDPKSETGLMKLFSNAKKQLEKILEKYHTMGEDVDKIYVALKKYENEIEQSNVKLETMFNANINYYQELLKYIMAGEQACVELDQYIEEYRQKAAADPTGTSQMDLDNLIHVKDILEQRVMDLKIAENVAMQTVPMLKAMQYSNLNLIRKINSAFIITMPVFKQSLAQAVMLKRQRVMAEGMSALDAKTNELLLKNAENTVYQTKLTTQLASGSSIKVETLEKTWQTIVNGIEETRQIQENCRQQRKEDAIRLQKIKDDYMSKMG